MRPSLVIALLCSAFLVASTDVAGAAKVADVRVDLIAPAQVLAGDTFDYVLTVRNVGPGDASQTTVTTVLDARSRFVRSDPACAFAIGEVRCLLGTLTPGQSRRITVTARVAPTLADGTVLRAYALGESKPADGNPGDNASSTAVPVNGLPDLAIDVSGPKQLLPGESGEYTVTVDNHGTDAAAVVVRARLDPVVRILDVPDGCTLDLLLNEVECASAELRADGWWAISLTGQAILVAIPGTTARMTAGVRSAGRDADESDNEDTWTTRIGLPVADLAVSVSRTPYGFEITIVNRGAAVTGARVEVVLAEGVLVRRLPDGCTLRSRLLTCVLDRLEAGAQRVIGISALTATVPPVTPSPRLTSPSASPSPVPSPAPQPRPRPRLTQPAALPVPPQPDDSAMSASDVLLIAMPLISMLVAARLFLRR